MSEPINANGKNTYVDVDTSDDIVAKMLSDSKRDAIAPASTTMTELPVAQDVPNLNVNVVTTENKSAVEAQQESTLEYAKEHTDVSKPKVTYASETEKQSMLDNLQNASTKEDAAAAWSVISKSYQSSESNIGKTSYDKAKSIKADLDKKFSSNESADKPDIATTEATEKTAGNDSNADAETTATSEDVKDKYVGQGGDTVTQIREEMLADDLAMLDKSTAQLYSETLVAEQKINHIFKNSFYTAAQPVPKWSFSVDFIPTAEAIQQYGNILYDWSTTLTKAIQSVQLPTRESTSVKSNFKGITIELPARTKNAGEFNIVFSESQNAEVMYILYTMLKTVFNTSYPTGEEILSKANIATETSKIGADGNETNAVEDVDLSEPTFRLLLKNHGHLCNIVVSMYHPMNAHAFNMHSVNEPSFVYMFHMCDLISVGGATYDYRSDKPVDITATFTYQYFEEMSFAAYKAKYVPDEILNEPDPVPAVAMNESHEEAAILQSDQFKTSNGGVISNNQLDYGSMTTGGAKAAEQNKAVIQHSMAMRDQANRASQQIAGYHTRTPGRYGYR